MLEEYETALLECLNRIKPIAKTENVLLQNLIGRVAAKKQVSPMNLPQIPLSAMDGIGINASQGVGDVKNNVNHQIYTVVGQVLAGQALELNNQQHTLQEYQRQEQRLDQQPLKNYQAWSLTTGATVPLGVTHVIPQEDIVFNSPSQVVISAIADKTHIKEPGSDLKKGELLFNKGHVFTAVDIALLASAGIAEVAVFMQLKVAVVSIGNELIEQGQTIQKWQTFDANRYGLLASLQQINQTDITVINLKDSPEEIHHFLKNRSADYDLLLTTGSASVGCADYLKQAIQLNGELYEYKLNMKPAKPFNMAKIGNCVLLSLPGNPLAALMSFRLLALPIIKSLSGYSNVIESGDLKRLAEPINNNTDKLMWVQVIDSANGVKPLVHSGGSSRLKSLVEASGFIALPANQSLLTHDIVTYYKHDKYA